MAESALARVAKIDGAIHRVRGHRVMLDADLAELYGVENRALIQAVKRNLVRFPEDFMFQLSPAELASLRSQIVISKGRGGRRAAPHAELAQRIGELEKRYDSRFKVVFEPVVRRRRIGFRPKGVK